MTTRIHVLYTRIELTGSMAFPRRTIQGTNHEIVFCTFAKPRIRTNMHASFCPEKVRRNPIFFLRSALCPGLCVAARETPKGHSCIFFSIPLFVRMFAPSFLGRPWSHVLVSTHSGDVLVLVSGWIWRRHIQREKKYRWRRDSSNELLSFCLSGVFFPSLSFVLKWSGDQFRSPTSSISVLQAKNGMGKYGWPPLSRDPLIGGRNIKFENLF